MVYISRRKLFIQMYLNNGEFVHEHQLLNDLYIHAQIIYSNVFETACDPLLVRPKKKSTIGAA